MLIISALTGCVHKMDIEQGNIITPEQVSKLHTGMTEAQVKAIMGVPVLTNTFTEQQMDYVYTYKAGYGPLNEKYVTLIFNHQRLQEIKTHL